MINNKHSTLNFSIFIEYLLIIFLILSCSSVYRLQYKNAVYFCCFLFTFFLFLIKPHRKFKDSKHFISFFLYLVILIFTTLLIASKDRSFYLRYWFFIPVFMFFSASIDDHQKSIFLQRTSNVILFLATSSLLLWLLGPFFRILQPINTVYLNWGRYRPYQNYYYLLYCENSSFLYMFGIMQAPRNLSIFPEGPFSSLIFCIGLTIELFCVNKKINIRKVLLYVIAILSCISTTGVILTILLLMTKYLLLEYSQKKVYSVNLFIKRILIPLIAMIISIIGVLYVLEFKETNDAHNYNSHMNAFGNGFQAFLDHPISGYGFNYDEDNLGNTTSGFFRILSYGGIPLGLLYIIFFAVGIIRSIKNKRINSAVICMECFLETVFVIWQFSFLCLALMCFFITLDKGFIYMEQDKDYLNSNVNNGLKKVAS